MDLQDSAAKQVVAACGVPLELLTDVPAASRREAYRQFVSTTVEALGGIIAEELSRQARNPRPQVELRAAARLGHGGPGPSGRVVLSRPVGARKRPPASWAWSPRPLPAPPLRST